jgi:hypothetical protein
MSRAEVPRSLESRLEDLASSEFLVASDALEALFDAGPAAIPGLLSALSDHRRFYGMCGRRRLRSEAFPVDQSEKPQWLTERIEVREVALYLLLAIAERRIYFADSCKLVGDPKEVERGFAELGDLDKSVVMARLWKILDRNHLAFPGQVRRRPHRR